MADARTMNRATAQSVDDEVSSQKESTPSMTPSLSSASLVSLDSHLDGVALPTVASEEAAVLDGFRWLRVKKLHWIDQTGRRRVWETCERTTRKGQLLV